MDNAKLRQLGQNTQIHLINFTFFCGWGLRRGHRPGASGAVPHTNTHAHRAVRHSDMQRCCDATLSLALHIHLRLMCRKQTLGDLLSVSIGIIQTGFEEGYMPLPRVSQRPWGPGKEHPAPARALHQQCQQLVWFITSLNSYSSNE